METLEMVRKKLVGKLSEIPITELLWAFITMLCLLELLWCLVGR